MRIWNAAINILDTRGNFAKILLWINSQIHNFVRDVILQTLERCSLWGMDEWLHPMRLRGCEYMMTSLNGNIFRVTGQFLR